MQVAKIVDLTRSFIPTDPNRFPETLHATRGEDFPEDRVPVIAYMGKNFLPTARGIKSFFGTNSHLDFTNLPTYFVDDIFIYQTETFLNILIALTGNGIFYKVGSTTGDWTQVISLPLPDDGIFYEWSKTVIENRLYMYRSNEPTYYVLETDPEAEGGVSLITVTPQFNGADYDITGMLGMTRLGDRLAFWDGSNALAFSHFDDTSDFTPDVISGSNITTFSTTIGKITDIRMHGKDAILYASKSVNYITIDPSQTFYIKATPLLQAGVAYKRQIAVTNPDTTHFCMTDYGIFKIESGKPEEIITEFYDYLKEYTTQPVFLKLLSGRFLFFEILDDNTLNGHAIFSAGVIPPATLTFAGNDNLSMADVHAGSFDGVCDYVTGIDNGSFTDHGTDATSDGVPSTGARKTGTSVTPVYSCYLSLGNGPEQPIIWGQSPCGVLDFKPSPSTNGGKLSLWSTDNTNKTLKAGTDVWLDGKWTMERFVQYQTAIWKIQQEAMKKFLDDIKSRTEFVSQTTIDTISCVVSNHTADCTIGRYPYTYTDPKFGWNKCSFWLTRWATSAKDAINTYQDHTTCDTVAQQVVPVHDYYIYLHGTPYAGPFGSRDACVAALVAAEPSSGWHWVDSAPGTVYNSTADGSSTGCIGSEPGYIDNTGSTFQYDVKSNYISTTSSKHLFQSQIGISGTQTLIIVEKYIAGHANKSFSADSTNRLDTVADFGPIPETAYCTITGWTWVSPDGTINFTAASTCTDVSDQHPGVFTALGYRGVSPDDPRSNQTGQNGSFCGQPLSFPGLIDSSEVYWPDTSLIYPESVFLLQNGSIAPAHPIIPGAFIYDLSLKKWGKMVTPYMQLLDYSPLNAISAPVIDFSVFGIMGGCIKQDGHTYIFDDEPAESEITYGKYGFYRAGVTDLESVQLNFARYFTGYVRIDGSLDGINLGEELTETTQFVSVNQAIVTPSFNARWYNFTIGGKFELVGLIPKGLIRGRR